MKHKFKYYDLLKNYSAIELRKIAKEAAEIASEKEVRKNIDLDVKLWQEVSVSAAKLGIGRKEFVVEAILEAENILLNFDLSIERKLKMAHMRVDEEFWGKSKKIAEEKELSLKDFIDAALRYKIANC